LQIAIVAHQTIKILRRMNYTQTDFFKLGTHYFPGFVGIEVLQVAKNFASARMEIKNFHFAPNDYLHAGSIVTLADTIAGYACLYNLPEKGISFTTVELKSNFLGSIKSGAIRAEASLQHSGKTTQVWDVTVINEENEKR
jgi:1,4-dihydroxy-2-naphthoyl-CoA hydrolase